MSWLALKMLIGNRTKYVAMLFGITFASLLICQQLSIFHGVMRMCSGQIRDVHDAPLWVLAPSSQYIDDLKPLSEQQLAQVRSVPDVAWAVPLQKGYAQVHWSERRGDADEARFQLVILMGLDDATLIGGPQTMIAGRLADLRGPDAIIVDKVGAERIWPGRDPRDVVGQEVTLNERRAVVAGVCRVSPTFQTLPIVYTRRSQAALYLPPERNSISAVLVQGKEGVAAEQVCREIHAQTGLLALTQEQWAARTVQHYMDHTGIMLNFLWTILLGFMVGVAVCGQTFYTFTLENLPQLGMLKAMGTTNSRLVGMILLQAGVVGAIGYCLGVGLAAYFGEMTQGHSKLVFFMPWNVLLLTGLAVVLVTMLASVLSISRVLRLEPAIVVR
jgi:putative ABC transport system permease protein